MCLTTGPGVTSSIPAQSHTFEESDHEIISTPILVTCLATDASLTADPGVASSIPARSHTFVESDHEIISIAILLPSADSRRVVVSYKRKYVHEVLVNLLVKLAQEKSVVR